MENRERQRDTGSAQGDTSLTFLIFPRSPGCGGEIIPER